MTLNYGIFPLWEDAGQYTPVVESGPVFADSSGRRHRVLRYVGLGAAVVLAVCLGAVVVAMTGGPQAPFTHWAVQQSPAARTGNASQQAAGRSPDRGQAGNPGSAGQAGGQNQTGGAPGSAAPSASGSPSPGASPSHTAIPTATPTATASATTSASPASTNPAGRTPPGHNKSPSPHKSANVA